LPEEFEYMYEIIIVSGDDDINELVCKIKEPLDKSKTFLMEIYGQNGATPPPWTTG
jgi:hypothetical protein